jgi:glycosyltransferase involved in cell wall biosynthesis
MPTAPRRLCLVARITGAAGPASFQRRLAMGLEARGHTVSYGLDGEPCDAVLVIGGSRRLAALTRARRRGVLIIQRLDGMNWIHRRRPTGLRHFLRAEVNNLLMRWTRTHLADRVVYQSEFVRRWWEDRYGAAPGNSAVIRNGVPLEEYSPDGPRWAPPVGRRLLVLEGGIGGGYEIGLTWGAELAQRLASGARRGEPPTAAIELAIAGRRRGSNPIPQAAPGVELRWLGEVPADSVAALLRSSALLFSADLHPACPNSVIEALACGLPVVAFDTGAIGEIVDSASGAVVPYGGDPWKVEPPDLEALASAARAVLEGGDRFRRGARRRAEAEFGLERMIDDYLAVLGWPS